MSSSNVKQQLQCDFCVKQFKSERECKEHVKYCKMQPSTSKGKKLNYYSVKVIK